MLDQKFEVSEELLASKGKRFLNHLLDLIPQYAVVYGLAYLFFYFGEFTGNYSLNNYWNNTSTIEDYLYSYLIMIGYYFLIETTTSRSIGKYVTNTMVVTTDGERPSSLTVFKRSLCRMIPFDALSFLGTKGKGWHDSISNTYVVDVKKFEEKKLAVTSIAEIGKLPEDI